MSSHQPAVTSAWTPLHYNLFRALWIAAIASNVGSWMQSVGAAWLMTSLTSSPLLIALLQAATSLPVFLVGLPAGAIADIVDRRRLLLITQGWMLIAAVGLSFLSAIDVMNVWLLLALTFALGLGSAMNAPAWQAITPELVPRSELPAAVALNGVGVNVARAVGPALAGIVVAVMGPEAVFLINAASFLGVMVVLYRWRRQPSRSVLPAERVVGAMQAGLRYVHFAPILQTVLVRTGIFISCGSALWALLPALARQNLGLDAMGYGALLGCMGIGAVAGVAILPKLRQQTSLNQLVIGASILLALTTATLAWLKIFAVLCIAMIVGGVAWVAIMSSLNAAVQMIVPKWVQARALGMYQLVFQGGMALGSLVWGAVANQVGTPTTLLLAALGLVVGLAAAVPYRLQSGENLDLAPSLHWAEPIVVIELDEEDGPVMVMLEYRIDPDQAQYFTKAMHRLRQIRRRDGAVHWNLCCDLAEPSRYIETFIVESWVEHKRQHERMTNSDWEIQQQARSFHLGEAPPVVSHLLYT